MVKIVDKILQDSLDGFIKERDEAKQRISELNEYIFELNQEQNQRLQRELHQDISEMIKSDLDDRKKPLSIKQRILKYLEDKTKPESTKEIYEGLGDVKERTVGSSLSKLVQEDKVNRHDTLPLTWSRKRG